MNRIQTVLFLMWMIGIPIIVYLFDLGAMYSLWCPIVALLIFGIMNATTILLIATNGVRK